MQGCVTARIAITIFMLIVTRHAVCIYCYRSQSSGRRILDTIQATGVQSTIVPAGEPMNTIRSCPQLLKPEPSVTSIIFITETLDIAYLDSSTFVSHAHHAITTCNLCCYTVLFMELLCNVLSKRDLFSLYQIENAIPIGLVQCH